VPLRSVERQFDNLKRVFDTLDEGGFQGAVCAQAARPLPRGRTQRPVKSAHMDCLNDLVAVTGTVYLSR
jgi:hypothetical protein